MRRLPCLTLASVLVLVLLELALSVARAQTLPDATPPLIEHEPLERITAAARQSFTARVVDDRELDAVTLHYRRQGEQVFARVPMSPLADSAFYAIAIDTDPRDERDIEYYLQAFDAGGNRTVNGYAFDPWRRELIGMPVPLAVTGPPVDEPREQRRGKVRWWHVALGAIAVGTLAALADGGSDGGGTNDPPVGEPGNDNGVPFTITLGEPR